MRFRSERQRRKVMALLKELVRPQSRRVVVVPQKLLKFRDNDARKLFRNATLRYKVPADLLAGLSRISDSKPTNLSRFVWDNALGIYMPDSSSIHLNFANIARFAGLGVQPVARVFFHELLHHNLEKSWRSWADWMHIVRSKYYDVRKLPKKKLLACGLRKLSLKNVDEFMCDVFEVAMAGSPEQRSRLAKLLGIRGELSFKSLQRMKLKVFR